MSMTQLSSLIAGPIRRSLCLTLTVLIQVHKVFPSGLAAQEGTIQKGDEVLSINGKTLRGITHADATAALRQARTLKLAVVVICKRAGEEGKEGEGCGSEEPTPAGELYNLTQSLSHRKKGVEGPAYHRACA